jgi:exopolysaccharide production protein ExoF
VGRVTSDRRAASPASGIAVFALLASFATIAVPNAGASGPFDRTDGSAQRSPEVRRPDLVQPAASRPSSAQREPSDKSRPEAAGGPPAFQLSAAELISVRVRGQSEVNGDYRVNPDLTISMPRLGRVAVGSMTAQELERHLGERLSASLRQDISVAVEVVRFRPFFMTGQVSQPGSVEWRPDLTLIQAISLSGGIMRSGAGDLDTPERRLLLEQARVRHSFAVAQLARVTAEKSRKEGVELDQILGSYIAKAMPESREALEAFLVRQNHLLEEQRAAHESRLAGMARERDSVLHELEATRLQSEEVKLQVQLTEAHMEGIESLKSQQLLTNSRYLEHRRALAEIRVRYSESVQLVQRARSRYNSLEREIQTVKSERDAFLNDRIEGLEREIAELELTLGGPGVIEASSGALAPSLTYHIARKTSAGVQTIVANLFTEILPGDVVIVSSKNRPRSASPESLTTMTRGQDPLEETQRIMEGAISPGIPASAPSAIPATGARRAAAHRSGLPRVPSPR